MGDPFNDWLDSGEPDADPATFRRIPPDELPTPDPAENAETERYPAPETCLYCDGEGNGPGAPCGFCIHGKPLDTQEDWNNSWGRIFRRTGGCTRACSEMHTFEPPCEQAMAESWWVISSTDLMAALRRVHDGEDPEETGVMTYLPMDCPVCGRRRLEAEIVQGAEPFVRSIECEKCGTRWPEHNDGEV